MRWTKPKHVSSKEQRRRDKEIEVVKALAGLDRSQLEDRLGLLEDDGQRRAIRKRVCAYNAERLTVDVP